jgi:hypothetical protein
MSIVALLILIALLGLVAYFITTLIPMPPQFKTLIILVALLIAILLVLQAFGLLPSIGNVQVPRVR